MENNAKLAFIFLFSITIAAGCGQRQDSTRKFSSNSVAEENGYLAVTIEDDVVPDDRVYPGGKTSKFSYFGLIPPNAVDPLDVIIKGGKLAPRGSYDLRLPVSGFPSCGDQARYETGVELERSGTPSRIFETSNVQLSKIDTDILGFDEFQAAGGLSDGFQLDKQVYINSDKTIVLQCSVENYPAGKYDVCQGYTQTQLPGQSGVVLGSGVGARRLFPSRVYRGELAKELQCNRRQLKELFEIGRVKRGS